MHELDKTLREPSPQDLALRNHNCIYCGRLLKKGMRTREHVIGRNFVPRGTLDCNLIAWACVDCNNDKSDLEDDISLISMLPAVAQSIPSTDKRFADMSRKLQSAISRRSGKLVRNSQETLSVTGQIFPGLTGTLEMVTNPQVVPKRVCRLARYHITAFHYLTTYRKETRLGEGIPGVFALAGNYRRSDWGNERARSFMDMTKNWDPRIVLKGKDAFFKAIIRRRMTGLLWSWALEWNQSFRVIGFYGDEELVEEALGQLPILKMKAIVDQQNRHVRIRQEIALPEVDDMLFEHSVMLRQPASI